MTPGEGPLRLPIDGFDPTTAPADIEEIVYRVAKANLTLISPTVWAGGRESLPTLHTAKPTIRLGQLQL